MLPLIGLAVLLVLGYLAFSAVWTIVEFILAVVIWAVIGYLAGRITRGSGFGIIGNIIVGLVGGYAGSLLFWVFGIGFVGKMPIIGGIIVGTIGAILVVTIFSFVTGRRRNEAIA